MSGRARTSFDLEPPLGEVSSQVAAHALGSVAGALLEQLSGFPCTCDERIGPCVSLPDEGEEIDECAARIDSELRQEERAVSDLCDGGRAVYHVIHLWAALDKIAAFGKAQ